MRGNTVLDKMKPETRNAIAELLPKSEYTTLQNEEAIEAIGMEQPETKRQRLDNSSH